MHGRSTDDLESADSQESQHETQSFAQVESSGPSFVDAGESHCDSVLAESRSGSVIDRTEEESIPGPQVPCARGTSQENHEGRSDSVPSPSHLPPSPRLPPSIEKEINELLEKQGAADISSQDSTEQPLSNEVHTSHRMPFAAPKRPDMVYFLTLQEQRLALAALAASEMRGAIFLLILCDAFIGGLAVPEWGKQPINRADWTRVETWAQRALASMLVPGDDAGCYTGDAAQLARRKNQTFGRARWDGIESSLTGRTRQNSMDQVGDGTLHGRRKSQRHPTAKARSWSPLRGTASTWMGSEPPGTAGTASSAASASEEAAVSPRQGVSKKGSARPRSGVRPVLIFPIKAPPKAREVGDSTQHHEAEAFTRRQRRANSPKQGRAGRRVRWLPPLRQLSAPQSSTLA
ncbi:unnamed protein product [Symbiodinium sp. CCMP2456]|nr:unnamed protein product [Symbiodinium sp. CCMP2456]